MWNRVSQRAQARNIFPMRASQEHQNPLDSQINDLHLEHIPKSGDMKMFETFGFETLTPRSASVLFGLSLGLGFGVLAFLSRFCLRRGLVGPASERHSALTTWLMALAVAVIGTQAAAWAGWISFSEHRFLAPDLPLVEILLGGVMFGAGMVLTRGCLSRLTVLAATGNLRAVVVLGVAALTALATLKGAIAPLRLILEDITVAAPTLPAWFAIAPVVAVAVMLARHRPSLGQLTLGALIGALVPLAWVGTGLVLQDEFDPITFESLAFTAPWADSLFWTVAASAVSGNFGTGLIGGVLTGALLTALLTRQFAWQGFETASQMGQYLIGGALMGVGGVFAGGCTVGAGMSGLSTLSLAAVAALGSIVLGALATDRLLARRLNPQSNGGSVAPSTTPATPPAA